MLLNVKVPPFNSTLMGLVRGVADFYGIGMSDAMLYGASGHAFMVNIHETLCPSGPYCWNREHFYALLLNLGIEMKDEGFFWGESTAKDRARIEKILREALSSQNPCGLVNMEYQLISGFDESGFVTSQPWAPHNDFPPKHLTFGTWAEFGKEIHVNFFTFTKAKPVGEEGMIRAGLAYALDVYANPDRHTKKPYATGAAAYDAWINAVQKGEGSGHGNWWNSVVWAECRSMASKFLLEIAPRFPSVTQDIESLSQDYRSVADALLRVSDKEMAADPKVALLREAKSREAGAVERLGSLVGRL